jgi:hypothetical protein
MWNFAFRNIHKCVYTATLLKVEQISSETLLFYKSKMLMLLKKALY